MRTRTIAGGFPGIFVIVNLLIQSSRPAWAERPIDYSGPIVITHGGTYSGNWQSLDPNTPAVTIRTAEPVVIANSRISSRSSLIKTRIAHAKLTVRDTSGYGLNPDVRGRAPGRFLDAEGFDNIDLENNYLEGTSGIYLLDANVGSGTVRVIANRALNIDGRKSDGAGRLPRLQHPHPPQRRHHRGRLRRACSSWQLDKVRHVPGMEVAWNQVINEPGKSRVEDNINIYHSSGTADSPLLIHDNYIQGAYTIKPWQGSYSDGTWNYDWGYSGGGILLGDGKTTDPAQGVVVRAGVPEPGGLDDQLRDRDRGRPRQSRSTTTGSSPAAYWPTGGRSSARTSGPCIWDCYQVGSSVFYNNSGHGNTVGWIQGTVRPQRLVGPERHVLDEQRPHGRTDHPRHRGGRVRPLEGQARGGGRDGRPSPAVAAR